MQTFNNNAKNTDYYTSEFEINDAPIGARNLLTKGFIQDEINQCSGAAISTRGKFMSKSDRMKSPNGRPLYLFIQGPTKQSIELAIQKIDEIIRADIGNPIRPGFGMMQNSTGRPGTFSIQQAVGKPPPSIIGMPAAVTTQVEKLYIGLDNLPASFDLRGKIIGQGGSNLHYIRSETGAAVTLRGRGSQFVEPSMGREAPEPLHLHIEHPRAEGLLAARQLAINLVETLLQELQPDMNAMSTPAPQQVLNLPPRILVAPPLSVPPPQQFINQTQNPNMTQHQSQQSQPIEQPMMMGNNPGNTQMQSNQHQQVILQQPPPIIRPPVVSIPPPGIHIPQHPGPLVPPPQLVQLSGPPPTASGSGNVLVVGPPPNQPLYLPPELVSSSSIGTFSLVQGGVLYHQAPPVQTQAQIGDGLHIITAPSHQSSDGVNITMSPHAHPPPQMIITQVRLEPDGHIVNGQGDHISHPFQQSNVNQRQKTQFHVIGHVHNQDHQGNMQQQHFLQQNRDIHSLDTMTHFSVAGNQTPATNSTGMTVPYHLSASGNSSNITTVTVSQNDQNQMYRQHMNIVDQNQGQRLQQHTQDMMKRPPRHVVQTGMLPQRQGDNRQIAIQMGDHQNSSERMMQAQSVLQMPPAQMMTDRMPPQIGQQSAPQMMVSRPQEAGQIVMNQQCGSTNANISEQLSQMPPHQFAAVAHISQPQMPDQHQFNQVQFNRSPYEQLPPRRGDQRRQDIQPANRQSPGNRNHRPGGTDGGSDDKSDSRLDSYPWSKNEPDKKYPNAETGWAKREGERDFDYDGNKPEDCTRSGSVSGDNRSRFNRPPGSDGGSIKLPAEDGRPPQYGRSDRDDDQYDGSKGTAGINAGQQRNFQQYDPTEGKAFDTSHGNWNRSDRAETQHSDRSPESGRKRRFDQEIPWKNRSENNQKSSSSPESSKPPHKKRFDQETYTSPAAGSQSSARSPPGKPFAQNDPPTAEKPATSKWSDPPGEGNTQTDLCENPKEDEEAKGQQKESPGKGATGPINQKQEDPPAEKQSDKFPKTPAAPPSANQPSGRQPGTWIEQRNDFKGNVQYTNPSHFNQFHQGQNFCNENPNSNDRQQYNPNTNFHPNYNISTAQMFQGNIPYLLPPPPPPPPTHSQNSFIHNFNMPQGLVNPSNPPPNIVSMSQNVGHNMSSIPQNVISNITQAPPNMVSDVTAHMQTMPPNMTAQNINQNAVPFDMAQSMMGNMVQHMPPSVQNAPPSVPQNVSNNGQNLQGNNMQGMNQMMPGTVPHNMGQMPQNISPYMTQNAPNAMNTGQNISHHVGQSSSMTPMNQSHVTQVPPATNQNMMHASMMTTNTPGMTVNMGNNNMSHNMQNPMGQMTMSMAPSMVPPPPNMISGQQNVPNMVPPPILPPNMTNRPHMGQMTNMGNAVHHGAPQNISAVPPPPPPPAVHNMTNQPPYPYWMN